MYFLVCVREIVYNTKWQKKSGYKQNLHQGNVITHDFSLEGEIINFAKLHQHLQNYRKTTLLSTCITEPHLFWQYVLQNRTSVRSSKTDNLGPLVSLTNQRRNRFAHVAQIATLYRLEAEDDVVACCDRDILAWCGWTISWGRTEPSVVPSPGRHWRPNREQVDVHEEKT